MPDMELFTALSGQQQEVCSGGVVRGIGISAGIGLNYGLASFVGQNIWVGEVEQKIASVTKLKAGYAFLSFEDGSNLQVRRHELNAIKVIPFGVSRNPSAGWRVGLQWTGAM